MIRHRFIQAGWQSYRDRVIPKDAPQIQIDESRQAFFAGAAILQATIMRALSPGPDADDADVRMMEDLQHELDEFGAEIDRKILGVNTPVSGRRQ